MDPWEVDGLKVAEDFCGKQKKTRNGEAAAGRGGKYPV